MRATCYAPYGSMPLRATGMCVHRHRRHVCAQTEMLCALDIDAMRYVSTCVIIDGMRQHVGGYGRYGSMCVTSLVQQHVRDLLSYSSMCVTFSLSFSLSALCHHLPMIWAQGRMRTDDAARAYGVACMACDGVGRMPPCCSSSHAPDGRSR